MADIMGSSVHGNMAVAVQPNGEHIRYERWVVEAWYRGELTDEFLLRPLRSAIRIDIGW